MSTNSQIQTINTILSLTTDKTERVKLLEEKHKLEESRRASKNSKKLNLKG